VAPYFGFRDAASARGLSVDDVTRRLDTFLAETQTATLAQLNVLRSYGLPLIAYEGGQALDAPGDATLTGLFLEANRDPRGSRLYALSAGLEQRDGRRPARALHRLLERVRQPRVHLAAAQPGAEVRRADAMDRAGPNPGVPPGR
jgi:hypothetical protein